MSHENLRAADFARSVEQSLKALGVSWVDLLLVHWPNAAIPLAETMGALARARRDGLARHVGVANFNIAMLDEAIRLCPEPLVTLQAEFHPYLDQTRVVAALRQRGMILTGYCPLGRGRLIEDPVVGEIARRAARRSRRSRCAGRSSTATSCRSRARRTRSGSRKISPCSISRSTTTRWRGSRRSGGATAASPIRPAAHPRGIRGARPVDIDLVAPGFERIAAGPPPLDQIAHGLYFGEGPVWDRRHKRFLWTDIIGDTIYNGRPASAPRRWCIRRTTPTA